MTSSDISPSLRPGGEVRKDKRVLGPHIPVN